MERRVSWILLAALLIAACDSVDRVTRAGSRSSRLDRETFIEVYVELRRAEQEAGTPEAFHARKQEILERYGTTPDALLEFIERHGQNVKYMAELWDTIAARLSDSRPGGTSSPKPLPGGQARRDS